MASYPLDGYRVTDFTWVWAGPMLTTLLADMGAEVIRIESRKRLDAVRFSQFRYSTEPEMEPMFHSVNRNKLGITVDISDPRGAGLIKELVKISDVVAENFSPRVLRKHGLDYESLREINPQIVMISLPAAGQYGPLRDIVSYAATVGALCGYTSLLGYRGEGELSEHSYLDINASIHGAYAVLAALYCRNRTGEGQYIDVSQLEMGACAIGEAFMEYFTNGRILGTQGNRYPTMAPHNNYPCKGEDRWVSIAVKTDEEWKSFCDAVGNPPWAGDEKFSDRFNRLRNQDELDRLVSAWTIEHTHYVAAETLLKAGVAATPCLDGEERYYNPHLQERQVHVEFPHPATGNDLIAGVPFKLSETPCEVRRHAPLVGEHNDYVFRELLAKPEEEIAQLIEQRVIY